MSLSERRWDTDEIGHGISDGLKIAPDIERLLKTLATPGWNTERPEDHLLPHLERACSARDSPWRLVSAQMDIDAVYQVSMTWTRSGSNLRRIRADVFALIGTIAESVTYVQQQLAGDTVRFDVCTGMCDGDGPFRPHGHLIRFIIELISEP